MANLRSWAGSLLHLSNTTYVWICIFLVMLGAMGQQARWNNNNVFVYDQGGYYIYLPAAFLFHDLGNLSWTQAARASYRPDQLAEYGNITLPGGQIVFKYPLGMAVAYSPWFALAKVVYYLKGHADTTGYEDMYEYFVSLGCLLYVMLGLAVLGKELRHYFSDSVAALTILILALGTNLFTYGVYEPLLSHGTLFMLNALLLRYTRRWYEQSRPLAAVALGLTAGLMVLIRPSELLLLAVPVLWGLTSRAAVVERGQFWLRHWRQTLLAAAVALLVASMQFVFWRVVGGQWLIPFYEGETFNFLDSHVWEGVLSVRKGWLLYSPLLVLALLGIGWVRRYARPMLPVVLVLVPVFTYVIFSWHDWGYGGSYGGRAMISIYPVLGFGLAAFWQRWLGGRASWLWLPVLASLLLLSINQNHQYSIGLIHWSEMTWELYKERFGLITWPSS